MRREVAIYGLFSPRNICLYVGATKHPHRREQQHRYCRTAKRFKIKLKVFFWSTKRSAPWAELKKTLEYKYKGQARFNKQGALGRMNQRFKVTAI